MKDNQFKPNPKSNMEDWKYWTNRMNAQFISMSGKKVKVTS